MGFEKMVESIGAMTELYKITFDSFVRVGFPKEIALDLTKHQMMLGMIPRFPNSDSENFSEDS
ncbi:MAG: hypothetical protein FWC20_01790 [Oscillospiraceae bacterium]|nr:hypothetical protein [Oscillospiraceae bacterium]MCL2278124.1 hypothetical protein [Oscillospiraceae bacterium]